MDAEGRDSYGLRIGRLTTDGQHEVWRSVWTYCTSIFVGSADTPARYFGSGTFVRAKGVACLLTAAHVWEEMPSVTELDARIGFTLETDHAPTWVPRASLQERFVSSRTSDEWGPDIALIAIHERDVHRLEVEKAFYIVDRERPLQPRLGATIRWGITGASDELSTFTDKEALLKNHMLATREASFLDHDGLDYVELQYGHAAPEDIPESWKGLSGAGLWMCHLTPGDTQAELQVIPILSGVAFYQRAIESRVGAIRCHGPQSLKQALDPTHP